MRFYYSTGGREKYYKKINVRDCATRALAISNNIDYKVAYKIMWRCLGETPRNGVSQKATNEAFRELGWEYIDVEEDLFIEDFENKKGKYVLRLRTKKNSAHVVFIENGNLYDTWNSSRLNPKVLGYWVRNESNEKGSLFF